MAEAEAPREPTPEPEGRAPAARPIRRLARLLLSPLLLSLVAALVLGALYVTTDDVGWAIAFVAAPMLIAIADALRDRPAKRRVEYVELDRDIEERLRSLLAARRRIPIGVHMEPEAERHVDDEIESIGGLKHIEWQVPGAEKIIFVELEPSEPSRWRELLYALNALPGVDYAYPMSGPEVRAALERLPPGARQPMWEFFDA